MIKPYYETELGVLYHGDCLEILPQIEEVDLVLTDPPYGMSYLSNYYKHGNPHKAVHGDNQYPIEILERCINLATCAVFAFCRWDNLNDIPKPKSFIVWMKNNWTAGDLEHEYGQQWEGIAFYPQKGHKFIKRLPDIIDCRRVPPTQILHPTEKPINLIEALIRNNSGDLIFDPYLGSGTTAVACERLGRKWIGIEISKEYCDVAIKRIESEGSQLKLDL